MRKPALMAVGILAAIEPTLLWAQDKTATRPEEITVTAAPLSNVLQPTQVLTGEQLRLKAAPTIGETLANEAGLSSSYFGPAASRPIIRGLGGSRVTVLIDRAATLDVSALSPDHAVAVETLLADQVEIIRGPSSLLFGSNAAGGIVNVVDNRIPDSVAEDVVSGAAEVRGDTAANERAIVGRLDGGVRNFAWHVDGYDRTTDNLDIADYATADPAERPADEPKGTLPNSYGDSDGYSVGTSWVGERGFLGAGVSGFKSKYGLPGPAEEGGDEPALYEGPFLDMDQTRVDVRGEYRPQSTAIETLKLAAATNSYSHREIEDTGDVATTFDNDQWEARLEAEHKAAAGFQGAMGLEFDSRDLAAIGEEAFISPSETRGYGLFVVEERGFDWGTLTLGARAEPVKHTNEQLPEYDETAFDLAGGLAFDIAAGHQLIANLSYTQRNPDLEELYSDGAHIATRQYEVGLLAVPGGSATTEDSVNVELRAERSEGDITWETAVFYYDIADFIYQDLTGAEIDDLPEAIYTQADANFYGAEAALNFSLWRPGRYANAVRLFGDLVKAELDDGEKLPRIPPWRVGASLTFGPETWETGLDVIYHAKQDDISSFNTDAYTMVNLNFIYRLNFAASDMELFLRGTNLADEDARKSTSFLAAYAPLPGRSLTAGLRARF